MSGCGPGEIVVANAVLDGPHVLGPRLGAGERLAHETPDPRPLGGGAPLHGLGVPGSRTAGCRRGGRPAPRVAPPPSGGTPGGGGACVGPQRLLATAAPARRCRLTSGVPGRGGPGPGAGRASPPWPRP